MELQDKKNTSKRNKHTGTRLERYKKSFINALEGIIYVTRYEHNMIIIICMMMLVTILGLILKIDNYEWLFIITISGLIVACEMINSALEAIVDLITTEINPLAKTAKDIASSATLVLCIASLIGGLIIFIPKIIEMFF